MQKTLPVTKSSFRFAFLISTAAMTGLFAATGAASLFTVLGIGLSLVIMAYMIYKKDAVSQLFEGADGKKTVPFIVLAVYVSAEYVRCIFSQLSALEGKIMAKFPLQMEISRSTVDLVLKIGVIIVAVLSIFAICGFLYAFYQKFFEILKSIYAASDQFERRFFVIGGIVIAVFIAVVFSETDVFYGYSADANGDMIRFDIIYTTDSPNEVNTNVFFITGAEDNDMRNPLFGLFALPFALPCMILAHILFFIPHAYAFLLAAVQAFLLLITDILIARMLKLNGAAKVAVMTAYTLTYTVLLHYVAMGQYVISAFWLILAVYLIVEKNKSADECLYAAGGALLTSVALFVFVRPFKKFWDFCKAAVGYGVRFLALMIIFGQFGQLYMLKYNMSAYVSFSGVKVGADQHVYQFLNFVKSIFLQPAVKVDLTDQSFMTYHLEPVLSCDFLGIALLALVIIGFLINRKDKFAQICMYWVAFSVFVLGIAGWGTQENGLIIYSLYFGWPYFALLIMLAEKLFVRFKHGKIILYCALSVVMAVINIPGLYDLIRFGIKYYPV